MNLSACLIVKDDLEVEMLNKALDSIQPYVDTVHVTSTGSEVTKIKEWCEKREIDYSHFKWVDDFSAARNFNFSRVPKDTDFIFWMDADDILIGGEKLKEIAQVAKDNHKDVVFFTYWYGCSFDGEPSPEALKEVMMEHNRERLIKPGTITWKKRLHETPIPVSGQKNNYTKYLYDPKERPVVVMHTSKDTDLEEKMQRNKRILELELMDERMLPGGADPRTLLYLMKIYAEMEDKELWLEAIEMGKEYLTKSGWDEERAAAWENMGKCYFKLYEFQQAAECFHSAIREWPFQPLIYLQLAETYYNLKNYSFAEYWMNKGAEMDIDNKGSNLTNLKAMKIKLADLLVKLNFYAKRDTKKALEGARLLYTEAPSQANQEQVIFLENLDELNEACLHVDKLSDYLDAIGETKAIVPLLDSLPVAITTQPFAQKLRNKYTQPRVWGKKEICYFANFGSAHFEKWDMSSLKSGIGGSETAVLELAKHWTELGYKVTIYGDPEKIGEQDGVTFLPYYYFNMRDSFNIFVQWRVPNLAGKIKARKFLVDLHDIFAEIDYDEERLRNIDKIMVKSEYHRNLAPHIPDEKFAIVGNGI